MHIVGGSAAGAIVLMAFGLAAGAGPARASSVTALEGSWTVAQAAVNGVARADGKLLNATWTFRGTELVVQSVPGERLRAALSFDATASHRRSTWPRSTRPGSASAQRSRAPRRRFSPAFPRRSR